MHSAITAFIPKRDSHMPKRDSQLPSVDTETAGARFHDFALRCLRFSVILTLTFATFPAFATDPPRRDMNGYLFIDGTYVSPPYDIRSAGDAIEINGQTFPSSATPIPLRRFEAAVSAVQSGSVVILYEGEEPLVVDRLSGVYELLCELNGRTIESGAIASVLPSASHRAEWKRLVADRKLNAEFKSRSGQAIAKTEAAYADGEQISFAMVWGDRLSYPLNLFAMTVVVIGFGHLLSNRPKIETTETEDNDNAFDEAKQIVGKSLAIVAMLSLVDLILTLTATHAGAMREVNPLGSAMIDHPVLLCSFKIAVTTAAIAILYRLHRRPIAQMASWWCCLVLTLLTARWVVFQSMFL
jgi:hypothetical protein